MFANTSFSSNKNFIFLNNSWDLKRWVHNATYHCSGYFIYWKARNKIKTEFAAISKCWHTLLQHDCLVLYPLTSKSFFGFKSTDFTGMNGIMLYCPSKKRWIKGTTQKWGNWTNDPVVRINKNMMVIQIKFKIWVLL